MSEKIYKTMKNIGTQNLVFGIITIVVGIAAGIVLIVSGSSLLKRKSDIMF